MHCHQKEVEKVMDNWMKHSLLLLLLLLPTYLGNLLNTPFVKKMNQYSRYIYSTLPLNNLDI